MAHSSRNADSGRQGLAQVAQQTLQILKEGCYEYSDSSGSQAGAKQSVNILDEQSAALSGSIFYGDPIKEADILPDIAADDLNSFDTKLEVTDERTLTAAHRLIASEGVAQTSVAVLNFASAKNPGGGFLSGARAQEENVTRCSGLFPCLTKFDKEYYSFHKASSGTCFYSDAMIFSPNVPVFRNDSNYELLQSPYTVSVVTSPAVNLGALDNRNKKNSQFNPSNFKQQVESSMIARIGKILAICVRQRCTVLVLGAWGCGCFRNEPADVARWFKSYLMGPNARYSRAFERVVFAVFDPSKQQLNKKAFSECLENSN